MYARFRRLGLTCMLGCLALPALGESFDFDGAAEPSQAMEEVSSWPQGQNSPAGGVQFELEFAPPPARHEEIPPAQPGAVWSGGYWTWRHGNFVWVPGAWLPERAGFIWVTPRWVRWGGLWRLESGYWLAHSAPVYVAPPPVVIYRYPAPGYYHRPPPAYYHRPPPPGHYHRPPGYDGWRPLPAPRLREAPPSGPPPRRDGPGPDFQRFPRERG